MKKSRRTDENDILKALRDAPFDGWPDVRTILAFSSWANEQTLARLKRKDLASMRVRDRIALGVRTRLEILEPHREALMAALRYLAPPPRNIHLPKMVWATADAIWRAAGDTATDYNHYTKRILLSGVITATTLYWLNDDSDDHAATWAFLDKRIDNVLTIGKALGKLKGKTA
jgi:ubiquinone biosynthesis protein COQ9